MYANLYKYVPLLMCLFQIAKILSLTISKCFDPAGQWHSPIYHLMDLTSSKDLDGAKTRKMTSLLFLPVLLLVFYMLFPIVFASEFPIDCAGNPLQPTSIKDSQEHHLCSLPSSLHTQASESISFICLLTIFLTVTLSVYCNQCLWLLEH